MSGIQFVTDSKGRKLAVQIDLRKHRLLWEDLSDGLMATARRKGKSVSCADYRAARIKRSRA
ncbi:MAG: hypothetical protein EXQ56_08720 [Acidobacteria bacterium]|nr:hypothetical protein [Acidobacteriota bacterium]